MKYLPVGEDAGFSPVEDVGADWSPLRLANLALWLDASDPSTVFTDSGMGTPLTATGDCGRWLDKSGGGHDPEVSASDKPPWTTNQQNGLASFACSTTGAQDWFDGFAAALSGADPITLYVVATVSAIDGNYRTLFDGDAGSCSFRFSDVGKANLLRCSVADLGSATNPVTAGQACVTTVTYANATGGVFRHNGAANGVIAPAAAMANNIVNTFAAAGGFFKGQTKWHEVLLYRRVASVPEMVYVENGLIRKWRIQ